MVTYFAGMGDMEGLVEKIKDVVPTAEDQVHCTSLKPLVVNRVTLSP